MTFNIGKNGIEKAVDLGASKKSFDLGATSKPTPSEAELMVKRILNDLIENFDKYKTFADCNIQTEPMDTS